MIKGSRFPNFISRKEIKLRLTRQAADVFVRDTKDHLPVYCYAPDREITYVTTIYFDTHDFRFYNRASNFRHDNLKIRLKEYYYELHDGTFETFPDCWIEVKRRLGESTSKHRFKLHKDRVQDLFSGEDLYETIIAHNTKLSPTDIRDIYDDFLKLVTTYKIRPYSATNYRRRTYQQPDTEDLRVTVDDLITFYQAPETLYNGASALTREALGDVCGQQKQTVIEIKTTMDFPDWLKRLLHKYPRSNFSKFLSSSQMLLRTNRSNSDAPSTPAQSANRLQQDPDASQKPS